MGRGAAAAVLAAHRWTGDGHRLLLANAGPAPVRVDWTDLPTSLDLPETTDGWSVMLATGEGRFGGEAGPLTAGASGIDLPAMTAVLLR